MTFQIQISGYFGENILEIEKRVGISCSHEDLSLTLEILWVGMSPGGHVLCLYKAINLAPSVSLPKTHKLKIFSFSFSCVSTAHQTSF